MTKEIKLALEEVKKYHPTVTIVVFNKYGQWFYCDDYFNTPVFDENIKQEVLQDASDSVETLPCVFQI